MYGCESWTIKKAECPRIDAFGDDEWWCWRRLLSVPWTARRSRDLLDLLTRIDWLINPKGNQSWIFIGRTDAEAETPILWPPNVKSQFIGKDPDAGKDPWCRGEGDDRGWDGWMASLIQWNWVWASSGRWWRTGKPSVLLSMGSQIFRHNWMTEQLHSE